MKAPLVATLICLCGAANAAICDTRRPDTQAVAARPGGELLLAATARTPAAMAPAGEPPHNERDLLLAGLALMAAIALRRTGLTS